MNVFNRIVMILSILFWIALVVFAMLDPLTLISLARNDLDYYEWAIPGDQFFYTYIAGAGVLLLFLLILLWLEIRHRRYKTVRIRGKGRGTGELSIDSVAQSLEYRVDELLGVRKVRPRVTSRGKDVLIVLDLDTSPTVNIPILTEQVVKLCQDVVEGQLGLRIHGKVRVNITHEPYARGALPVAKPVGRERARRLGIVERPTMAPSPVEPVQPANVIVDIDTKPTPEDE
jgi:hypothetical protein